MLDSASHAARLGFFAIAGLISCVLSLALVYVIANAFEDFDLMGLYVLFIFPAGALLVGAIAGCGFALAAWLTGLRFSTQVFTLGFAILTLAYMGAHWIEYQSIAHQWHAGFLSYFDFATRNTTFSIDGGNPFGLGAFGYLFRLLELTGFVGGGLGIQYAMSKRPHCEESGRYMRKLASLSVPYGLPAPPEAASGFFPSDPLVGAASEAVDAPPSRLPDENGDPVAPATAGEDQPASPDEPAPLALEDIDGTAWRTDALLVACEGEDTETFARVWGELQAQNGQDSKVYPRMILVFWHCPVSSNGELQVMLQSSPESVNLVATVRVPKALVRAAGGGRQPARQAA